VGTIFNIWGNYYTFNYSITPEEADQRALICDYEMIGKDFKDILAKDDILMGT
jgi:hypothetical protein